MNKYHPSATLLLVAIASLSQYSFGQTSDGGATIAAGDQVIDLRRPATDAHVKALEGYSGGQMTDWGAHHIDIAQWAIGSAPLDIEGRARYPSVENGYNVPVDFHVTCRYPGGVVMTVSDEGRNGIMLTGTKGRIFVNRGSISGAPVEALAANPLPREKFMLYDHDNLSRPERFGKLDAIINHMGNFFDCVASRRQPISDVESQHRSVSTCHLSNISMRVGRPIKWDAKAETILEDSAANSMLRREQRSGFEVA